MSWWESLKPGGKLAAVAFVVVVIVVVWQGVEHIAKPPAKSAPVVSKSNCQLTVSALGAIGLGLRDREDTKSILESAGILGSLVCQTLITNWRTGGTGTATVGGHDQQFSGSQVLQLPTNVQEVGLNRALDCIAKYGSGPFERLCYEGTLSP